jgi:hypothetical protein
LQAFQKVKVLETAIMLLHTETVPKKRREALPSGDIGAALFCRQDKGWENYYQSGNSPFESRLATRHDGMRDCFEPEESLPLYFLFLFGSCPSRDTRQLPIREFAARGREFVLLAFLGLHLG